jgi:hypothetical protein
MHVCRNALGRHVCVWGGTLLEGMSKEGSLTDLTFCGIHARSSSPNCLLLRRLCTSVSTV